MDIYDNEQSLQERSVSHNITPQVDERLINKREVQFVRKEETKERKRKRDRSRSRSTMREDTNGIDVTELVVSKRDSKTGKRFKVFSTASPHQYGISC